MGRVVVPPRALCLPTQGPLLIPQHSSAQHAAHRVLELADVQDGSLNLALLKTLFYSPEVPLTSAGSGKR